MKIEFIFDENSVTFELSNGLERNPVKNGVRLLRGMKLDPQEVKDVFLTCHGERYSVLNYLINGLHGESEGIEPFAAPLTIEKS